MNKFQRLIKYTFSYVGGFFSTHPVTFITVCAGTLMAFVEALSLTNVLPMSTGASKQLEMILAQFLISAFIFCMFAFFLESSPLKQKMPPFVSIPVYVIGGGLSFILGSLVFATPDGKELILYSVFRFYREMIGTTRTMLILFGVCTILFFVGVYFCYEKMEEVSFSAYITHVFSGLFFAWITFGFLSSGTASLTGIFTLLLWGDFEKIFFPLIVLILGGYFILRCASCFTERPKEVNGFIYVLIRYVLLIMSVIAYVIIYIYMIKILVLREFPSNSVYAILTSLFVISMPIAYMSAGMVRRNAAETDGAASRDVLANIARFLPVVFIPFIFLQVYTTWVRIAQYGLTVKRYFGVLFIVFEVVFIALYIISLRKKSFRLSLLLPVFAGFVLFSSLLPFVNAQGLSKIVQVSCINSYLQKKDAENLGEHVKSRAAAAYEALRDEEKGTDYLKARFSEDDRKTLDLLIKRADVDPETDNLEWSSWEIEKNEVNVDVSAYSRMQYAYLASSGTQNAKGTADLKKTGLYLNTAGNIPVYTSSEDLTKNDALQTFDLTDFAERYVELSKKSENNLTDYEYQNAMQEIQTIRLNDQVDFYITEAEVRYRTDNDQVVEFLLQGYYLTK